MKSKYEWIRKAQRCLRMLSELHRLGFQHLRGIDLPPGLDTTLS